MPFQLKMAGTSCTDGARVKIPSFQKVTIFFLQYEVSIETPSICIFVCVKMILTAVIRDEHASNDLLQSDSSFLFRNRMMTNTISSLIIGIQLFACNLQRKFALFCKPYYL